ncbi:hypothetical protein L6164_016897 [Bauhinia variegata]|uniref:Uncharacterized protein n=1 Tax=Bauhinia variegata TaxID=167791 RepID=A0ACB9N7D0_BAUVA|nr:hypothetical protein L6164_016897 [Bauhinia variegata]
MKLKEKLLNENDQEKHFIPEEFISSELSDAVKGGNPDDFLDILMKVSTEKHLSLSAISNQVTGTGDSLLHLAALHGREEIAGLIAQHFPKLLIKTNIKGDTALHVAARTQKSGVVKIILHHHHAEEDDHTLLTRMQNVYGNTPLHDAVESNAYEVVDCLYFKDSLASHIPNKSGKSPMYLAVLASDDKICSRLLQSPFQVDTQRFQGDSPLHAVILEKKSSVSTLISKILKERPELMYLKNENGDTPLHFAASKGNLEAVETFLKENSSANSATNTNGYLPIHVACQNGKLEILKKFLQKFPELAFALTMKGQNILHVAAKNGHNKLVKYILSESNFGDHLLNKQDNNGNTPLHLASKDLQLEVLHIFTKHEKIELNLKNNDGKEAWDFISIRKKTEQRYKSFLRDVYFLTKWLGVPVRERIKSLSRQERDKKPSSNLKDLINILMLVSILVSTVTFAAGFALPGGVDSGSDEDKRGTAVLVNDFWFQIFSIFNSHAMFSSMVATFVLFWASLVDDVWVNSGFLIALLLVCYSLVGTLIAFLAASRAVMIHSSWIIDAVTIGGDLLICAIPAIILLWGFPLGVIDQNEVWRPAILHDIFIRIWIGYAVSPYKEPEEESNPKQMEKQVSKKMK